MKQSDKKRKVLKWTASYSQSRPTPIRWTKQGIENEFQYNIYKGVPYGEAKGEPEQWRLSFYKMVPLEQGNPRHNELKKQGYVAQQKQIKQIDFPSYQKLEQFLELWIDDILNE